MFCKRIEKLKQQYTGQLVSVSTRRPELARYAKVPAQVRTVNCSGRALVQFEGPDRGWHDIELDDLKVVDRPSQDANGDNGAAAKPEPEEQLSRLELARLQKPS